MQKAPQGRIMQGEQTDPDPTGRQVRLISMPNAGRTDVPSTGNTYGPNGDGSCTAYDQGGNAYAIGYAR